MLSREVHRLLQPRWVFTDKHDGLGAGEVDLPVKALARIVVPGYKDVDSYGVRKDAPTACRTMRQPRKRIFGLSKEVVSEVE